MKQIQSRRQFLQSAAGLAVLGMNIPFANARSVRAFASREHEEIMAKYLRIVTQSPKSRAALDPKAVTQLYKAVLTHPVARPERLPEYDPDGAIGFCFGRDMTAFLLARKMGLDPQAMRSLFIVGDLRSAEKPEWRFHVTKIVRLTDGSWAAVDPIVPQARPLRVQDWINTVRAIWDKKRLGKLYVTPPYAVLPDVRNMQIADQETGRDLIELSFNPQGKSGIEPAKLFAPGEVRDPVYELTPEGAKTYFLTTDEPVPDAFPFDRLVINNATFPFRGYFSDLMDDLLERRTLIQPEALEFGVAASARPARVGGVPPAHYGMTFDANFWRAVRTGRR